MSAVRWSGGKRPAAGSPPGARVPILVQTFDDAPRPAHAGHREFGVVAVLRGDLGGAAADTAADAATGVRAER
jgi:hypothetical protein